MDFYLLLGTVSLTFQLMVLALLTFSFRLKQHLKFRMHGITMMAALSVHLTTVVVIMVPSLVVGLAPKIAEKPASAVGLLSPLHAAAGAATAVLALWIVGSWRLRQSTKFCAPKKKFMRFTFILWLISVSLGVALYFVLYWSSL